MNLVVPTFEKQTVSSTYLFQCFKHSVKSGRSSIEGRSFKFDQKDIRQKQILKVNPWLHRLFARRFGIKSKMNVFFFIVNMDNRTTGRNGR